MKINPHKTALRASRIRDFAEKLFFCCAAVLFAAAGLSGQSVTACHYGQRNGIAIPDPACTPGWIATTDPYVITNTKWGKDKRAVTPAMKKAVCLEYGVKNCPSRKVEVDHLLPRCAGGADDTRNLWVQRDFKGKDKAEAQVCKELKAHFIDVPTAQKIFLSNGWADMVAQSPPKP